MAGVETADVVIVGGGVIGASLAYHLARRRVGRVALLEQRALGSGSTGRSVASIDLFTLHPAAAALHAASHGAFLEFEARVGAPCGFVRTGFAALAGVEQAQALHVAVAVGQGAGMDVRLCSPQEFAALEPAARADDLALAAYAPAAGHADPALTTGGFGSAARRLGVAIHQDRAATALRPAGGGVVRVETGADFVEAPAVVIAAGPWSGALLRQVGFDAQLTPVRHAVACLRRPPEFGPAHLSVLDLQHSVYARPETGGLTLLGSTDPRVGYEPVAPAEQDAVAPAEYALWAAERLVRRYPALEAAEVRPGWTGVITISPDWQPLVGAVPELPGLYCAVGFSGQGFKISPAVGELLAGLISGERTAAALLAPFRPTRFAEGEPLTTPYTIGTLG